MSPMFFQQYWHIVGDVVIAVVLQALQSGTPPFTLNHTFITLIPKIKRPEEITEFRPINLCNVVYKLISKVLLIGSNLFLMMLHLVPKCFCPW